MAWSIRGRDVVEVGVIDDEPASRESIGWMISDADLQSKPIEGPLPAIDDLVPQLASNADAFICDHHLQIKNYARFDGAELVARSTQEGILSILCTKFSGTDMVSIRPLLPFIPVLVRPDELKDPEDLRKALTECAAELAGEYSPERKGWRTQVLVERIDEGDGWVDVSVPAWIIEESVRISFHSLPTALVPALTIGFRCHATVNLGAESAERLFLHKWEFDVAGG